MIIKLFPEGTEGSPAGDKHEEPKSTLAVAQAIAAETPGGEGETVAHQDDKTEEGEEEDEKESESEITKSNGTEEEKKDEVEDKPEGETEGDGQEDQEEKSDEAEEEDDDKVEDKSKDFDKRLDKHPRFVELTAKVKDLEPYANRMKNVEKWMKDNCVEATEVSEALNLVSLLKNPAKADEAFKVLEPIFNGLQMARGETLPDDLKKDVEAGDISLPRAKELAKSRARQQMMEQTSQQSQRQAFANSCFQAVSSWEESARKTDPDFEKKVRFIEPALRAKVLANPTATPEERVRYCVEIHKEVSDRLAEFAPRPKSKKTLPSDRTRTITKEKPKSTLDVALAIANKATLDD